MIGSEEMPRLPNRANSIDTHDDDLYDTGDELSADAPAPAPAQGIQASGSASDDSLFGDFIKGRQDAMDFDLNVERPLRDTDGRSKKHATSRNRQGSKSPDPTKKASTRSGTKSRSSSKSPRTTISLKVLSSKSSSLSPSGKANGRIRSPRGVHKSQGKKSPREPKRSLQEKAGGPVDLSSVPTLVENSSIEPSEESVADIEINDDAESVPGLVDDFVVREPLEGFRAGKQWNIMEDTPGGHAEEKLVIISAFEYDEGSLLEESLLEEDDDIDDDHDDHSFQVARTRGQNSLPSDPSSANVCLKSQDVTAGRDRFAPAFKNHQMWTDDAHLEKKGVKRFPSSDVSLLSEAHGPEDIESVSELGNSTFHDIDAHALTSEEKYCDDDEQGGATKTPATTKRRGGRRLTPTNTAPNLDTDSASDDDDDDVIEGGALRVPVPEDSELDGSSNRKPRRRRKPPSSRISSPRSEKKGSNSTGRSSQRRSTTRGRKERDALRGKQHRKIPDIVPATPSAEGFVRSPLSSSLTSTPNSTSFMSSLMSSVRSQQQHQSLQALRKHHSKSSSPGGRLANKPLNLHVERGRDRSHHADGDDNTLGASTITTNFSTTQRTRGDNTVSTRSLFQSERMNAHETLKIPQRRSAGSESDDSGVDVKQPPQQPRRSKEVFLEELQGSAELEQSEDDFLSELEGAAELEGNLEDPFDRKAPLKEPSGGESELNKALRCPSIKGDEIFSMIENTMHSQCSEELSGGSSNASSFMRWQKESGKDLISPQVKIGKHSEGVRQSKTFLQLNPGAGTHGIVVGAEVTDVPDLSSPIRTPGTLSTPPAAAAAIDSIELRTDQDESQDKFNVGVPPASDQRVYGVHHAPDSPTDMVKKSKKKTMLALFRRVKSWKGVVALHDDDEERPSENI